MQRSSVSTSVPLCPFARQRGRFRNSSPLCASSTARSADTCAASLAQCACKTTCYRVGAASRRRSGCRVAADNAPGCPAAEGRARPASGRALRRGAQLARARPDGTARSRAPAATRLSRSVPARVHLVHVQRSRRRRTAPAPSQSPARRQAARAPAHSVKRVECSSSVPCLAAVRLTTRACCVCRTAPATTRTAAASAPKLRVPLLIALVTTARNGRGEPGAGHGSAAIEATRVGCRRCHARKGCSVGSCTSRLAPSRAAIDTQLTAASRQPQVRRKGWTSARINSNLRAQRAPFTAD